MEQQHQERPKGVNIWNHTKLKAGSKVYKRGRYLDNKKTGSFDIIVSSLNIANHNTREVCSIETDTEILDVFKNHFEELKWFREGILMIDKSLYSHKDIFYLLVQAENSIY